MKILKAALCQILSLDGDRSGNFIRIENALCEAKEAGADIACFPEAVVLGWVNPDAHRRAYPIPGKDSERLAGLAKKYETCICAGLAEKRGKRLYSSALLIDRKGQILLKHRKINILPALMDPPYTPGSKVQAVETEFGKAGILICADTFQDEILKRMAALKPRILLVPYGWAAQEEKWPGHGKELLKVIKKAARAVGAPVVGTDLVGEITHGPWKGRVYGGQSAAVRPSGQVIALARDRDRDVCIASIELFS